jgi:DNA-binding response OmpR family regulator
MVHRVLVVEDEGVLASNIRTFLEHHDYQVHIAGTLAAGLGHLVEMRPDVVIVDILLPDGDGREILRRARSLGLDIGIIIMTAFGSVPLALDAMTAGADDYVEKPVPLDTLRLLVDRAIVEHRPSVGRC